MNQNNYHELLPKIEAVKKEHQEHCDETFHGQWHNNRAAFYANLECVMQSFVVNMLYHTEPAKMFDAKQMLREYLITTVDKVIAESDQLVKQMNEELIAAEREANSLLAMLGEVLGIDLSDAELHAVKVDFNDPDVPDHY